MGNFVGLSSSNVEIKATRKALAERVPLEFRRGNKYST
jgi:hypothetical protein